MADVATPSGAAMFDAGNTEKKKVERLEKPEKPDEAAYKENLAKAEKELSASLEKLVGERCGRVHRPGQPSTIPHLVG